MATTATTTTTTATPAGAGPLLRDWRRRRRLSQLDLALEAGISARHLSFVETGRSKPSAEMLLRLAEQLDVPLRARNQLLLAGGYAPAFPEHELDAPEMAPVHDAIQRVLDGHDPYPALVVDRRWNVVAANHSLSLLTVGAAPELLRPPTNAMRLALHPDGLAPRIVNLAQWRAHLLERLERQVAVTGDRELSALRDEVAAYPAPAAAEEAATIAPAPAHDLAGQIAVPLRLRHGAGELAFISIVATFGTAVDITVAELSIESFFPADAATADAVRRYADGAA
ncbi:helix-turn-helix transcriptional regulator [Conexibacter stalactiti]|uniref:Helix-turn-helix transcriptional regulator n=1 Tax=Conexibacter stalactiti TaxID=1940611 RepID=A0ABU4HHI1_9ACTN|nr:helix-turn-helix transcriptional regulator [Conexibacter stalactiti]MDW5592763.1 helix-turn-helix transcriptional regulator [Conexibacter stalactiti]MEC5033404.1 helix-turn-helix transcriptional regulator [Conexibacter stalactiti]